MAEETKDEDHTPSPEERIAQRRLKFQENMALMTTPLEHMSKEEISGYSKTRLKDLAHLHDVRHGKNITQNQLLSKILQRRQEMLDDIRFMERQREENRPNENSPHHSPNNANNNNNNDPESPQVDGETAPTATETRRPEGMDPDPPDTHQDHRNQADSNSPEVRNRGEDTQDGGDEFVSTPAGFSSTSHVSINDISRMLNDNIEELQRIHDEREYKTTLAMEARDEALKASVSRQLGLFQESLLTAFREELQLSRRQVPDTVSVEHSNGNGPADDNTNFTKQWETARNAAAANTNRRGQNRFAALPSPMGIRFGATSPTGNFRGCTVGLHSVHEEESQNNSRDQQSFHGSPTNVRGGPSPITSPPLYAPTNVRGGPSPITSPPLYEHRASQLQFRPSNFGTGAFDQARPRSNPFASTSPNATVIGTSPLDDPKRGDIYSTYLVGINGVADVEELDLEFLESLGFIGEEVNKIITRGVQQILRQDDIPDINPKYYSGFNKLEDLEVEHIVDFYCHLAIRLKRYGVALLDFDAVLPRWHHIGMTYPGIGEVGYLPMSETLFNLLEKLLPLDDPTVKQIHTSLTGVNHDGFQFLRKVLGKFVPVFCPYKTSDPPTWRKTPDVAHMAKLWKLHFKLSRKTGSNHTYIQKSLMFLQSLKDPSLSANVTSVRGQIQIFMEQSDAFEDTDIILPTNLTIDGITNTLTAFPAPMESSISFATANRYSIDDSSDDETIDFQGFSVNATTSSRSNDRSTRGSSRKPKANRKEDKKDTAKDVVCRSCHKKGHKEVDCRELAK